jgi:transglutaminase-like putative cysteine protease
VSNRPALKVLQQGGTWHTLRLIPAGDAGIKATLRIMRDIVRGWRSTPLVRNTARSITGETAGKQFRREAATLQRWVQNNIKYQQDVADVETVQTPDLTLRDRAGDCDDQSVLIASLLQAIGHPVRFVAVAFEPGGEFSHVFAETRIGGYWLPVETTEPYELGQFPPGVRRHLFENV